MPRVHSVVARAAQRERSCAKCGQSIEVGQAVYSWTRRNWPTSYQHQDCGYPRPSQLYSRKTAVIEDLVQEADFIFEEPLPEELGPGDTLEIDTSHVESVLEDIANIAEAVGDEYEESAENLPEGLQQGYQAEAMRDVAERLRDWADNLRDVDFERTVDLGPYDGYESMTDWRSDMQGIVDDAVGDIIDAAQTAIGDMPEYEG